MSDKNPTPRVKNLVTRFEAWNKYANVKPEDEAFWDSEELAKLLNGVESEEERFKICEQYRSQLVSALHLEKQVEAGARGALVAQSRLERPSSLQPAGPESGSEVDLMSISSRDSDDDDELDLHHDHKPQDHLCIACPAAANTHPVDYTDAANAAPLDSHRGGHTERTVRNFRRADPAVLEKVALKLKLSVEFLRRCEMGTDCFVYVTNDGGMLKPLMLSYRADTGRIQIYRNGKYQYFHLSDLCGISAVKPGKGSPIEGQPVLVMYIKSKGSQSTKQQSHVGRALRDALLRRRRRGPSLVVVFNEVDDRDDFLKAVRRSSEYLLGNKLDGHLCSKT